MRKRLLLVTGCILCLVSCNTQHPVEKDAAQIRIEEENENTESIHGNDLLKDEVDASKVPDFNSQSIEFNWNGYKFIVPGDYSCTYADEIGPIIYLSDVFQMKINAKQGAYSELIQKKESLVDTAKEAGAVVLSEVQEMKITDNSYTYFKIELNGDPELVVYSETPDKSKHFGAQIVIRSDSVTDEDLLNMYASIVEKVTVTDEPDSSLEDIAGQNAFVTGEKKESSSLTLHRTKINYKVPSGYYSIEQFSDEYSATECFDGGDVSATVTLYKANGDDAKYCAEISASSNISDEAQMTSEAVGGRTVYVVSYSYEYNGSVYRFLEGYCDINENVYYEVKLDTRGDTVLSFDMMRDFFQFN
ncbi:MAG: hypothetical protein K2L07_10925 [Lachnospiraceae bacterium]|nr:hypothetical protein [Lachnospiraceae bacterium]